MKFLEKRGETQLFKLNSGKEKDKLAVAAYDAVHFAYHAQIVVKSVFTMISIYGDRVRVIKIMLSLS